MKPLPIIIVLLAVGLMFYGIFSSGVGHPQPVSYGKLVRKSGLLILEVKIFPPTKVIIGNEDFSENQLKQLVLTLRENADRLHIQATTYGKVDYIQFFNIYKGIIGNDDILFQPGDR